jgi:hypothetical protein
MKGFLSDGPAAGQVVEAGDRPVQPASANLNPSTEAKPDTKNFGVRPAVDSRRGRGQHLSWAIANASFMSRRRNEVVTGDREDRRLRPFPRNRRRLGKSSTPP